jgi:hypothetical protein
MVNTNMEMILGSYYLVPVPYYTIVVRYNTVPSRKSQSYSINGTSDDGEKKKECLILAIADSRDRGSICHNWRNYCQRKRDTD